MFLVCRLQQSNYIVTIMEDRKQKLALAYLKLLSKAIKLEFDIDTPTPVDQTITFVDILDRTTPKKENDEILEDLPSPPHHLILTFQIKRRCHWKILKKL